MVKVWKNWSETVSFVPQSAYFPKSKDEIIPIVKNAIETGKKIRVIGSGHSFTPLINSEVLVSLDNYQGIIRIDPKNHLVTVKSGTKLKLLGELLFEEGLMMENLGDIDVQSIAGAISTGTHGTGLDFGILSTQIHSIEFVNGKGELVYSDAKTNPEIFKSILVSFGVLGIITEITLKVVPAYKLHYHSSKTGFEEILNNLDQYIMSNRNFEFYYFPYSEYIQLKESNITNNKVKNNPVSSFINDRLMENTLFGLICKFVKVFPKSAAFFSKLAGATISTSEKTDYGHKIYSTIRKVKFVEMEYSIPISSCSIVLRRIRKFIEENEIRVNFPIEVRFVRSDDIYLSPAYGEDRCFIAVHMYKGMPYEEYFKGCEQIFLQEDGRPHWGKMHFLFNDELKIKYPEFQTFDQIRSTMDPNNIFLNDHTSNIFLG